MPSDDLGAYEDAGQRVDDFLAGVGWQAHMVAPERERLVRLLVALEGLGMPVLVEALESFVDAAQRITGAEFDRQESIGDAAMIVAQVVLFEVAFAIMRRMASSNHLAQRADTAHDGADPSGASPKE
jgi:hypothetical protein